MDAERDYSKDIELDPDKLDVEWLVQPKKSDYYAKMKADAREVYRRAKQKVKSTYARLLLEVRSNPSAFGVDKLNDTIVDSAIQVHKDYLDAVDNQNKAEYELEVLEDAYTNVRELKYALQDLVKLHATAWFAGPIEPHDLPKTQREYLKEYHQNMSREDIKQKIHERLNRVRESNPENNIAQMPQRTRRTT